jgi:hypothetical protein
VLRDDEFFERFFDRKWHGTAAGKSGYLFATSTGSALIQRNVLRWPRHKQGGIPRFPQISHCGIAEAARSRRPDWFVARLIQAFMTRAELDGTPYGKAVERRLTIEGFPVTVISENKEALQFSRPQPGGGRAATASTTTQEHGCAAATSTANAVVAASPHGFWFHCLICPAGTQMENN